MNYLFLHQNFPGQFRHLAPHLAADPANRVVFLTQPGRPDLPGIEKVVYTPHRAPAKEIHPYLRQYEASLLNAQGVVRAAQTLQGGGFVPDLMIGNPGWGETLFLKDVFPDSPLLSYCEFYYRGRGSDVGFDPEFSSGFDAVCRARARAAPHLLAVEAADRGISPTHWQKAQFPRAFHDRIEVIHDGIDTDRLTPGIAAEVTLQRGGTLRSGDEVVTFVARNLEPYRGFHTFMRALPQLLELRPNARVLVIGGDGVSYGGSPKGGGTWRQTLLAETGLNTERVHFLGQVPYARLIDLLRVSAAHVYLTYPFVLSWSMLEAMALGCHVIGSRTPPVEEVIEDGRNGTLVDFFDAPALAETIAETLVRRNDDAEIRRAASATIADRFALSDCLARQMALVEQLT
jgi:glycosyltransferase involved in cell wall biosynthesis